MARKTAGSLFLIDDLARLRAKVRGLQGPLAGLWDEMRRLVQARPEVSWMLSPFVATVTDEPADVASARESMLTYAASPGDAIPRKAQKGSADSRWPSRQGL